jgi:hypothetical protein
MQNKNDWWTHYCFKKQDHMSFLKKDACDWCGEKYHDDGVVFHPQQLLTKKILPIDIFYKVFNNGS